MAKMSVDEIKALWVQAGGNPVYAGVAAAVALAESAGDPGAEHVNTNGSTDRGLWQVNSIHGTQSTLDPLANAKAAVSLSNNGLSWRPWCTAYTDGSCGQKGGVYNIAAGSGSSVGKFIQQATGGALPDPSSVLSGSISPTNPLADPARAAADASSVDGFFNGIMADFYMTVNVVLNNLLYLLLAIAGGAAVVIGIIMLSKDSVIGNTLSAVKGAL